MATSDKTKGPASKPADPVNPNPAPAPISAAPTLDPGEGQTLRGYVIERSGPPGEGKSWFQVGPGGGGWTWDKERATVFPTKEAAKPLVAKKKLVDGKMQPAGLASNEGAKVVKYDDGADDPA